MPANNHFFVHIVESPSEDDLLDGRTEGRVLLEALRLSGIPATYNLVTSRRTLEFALRERRAEAASQLRRIPIVHLSMHGNQHGVSLTGDSGSTVEWQELRDLLLPINEQYSGALVVCFSSCFGAAGCKMAMREEGPVPFLAVVGHYGEAAWSDAAVGFVTFYHRLGKAATIFDAVAAMKVASGDNRFDVLLGQRVQQDYLRLVEGLRGVLR